MARALSPPCCRSKCWRLRNSQLGATFEQKSPRLEYRYPNSLPFHEGLPESPTGIDPSGVHCGSGLDHAPLTGSLTSPSPAPVSRDSLPNKPHAQGSLSQDLLWGNPRKITCTLHFFSAQISNPHHLRSGRCLLFCTSRSSRKTKISIGIHRRNSEGQYMY